jgi:hypothetical protein
MDRERMGLIEWLSYRLAMQFGWAREWDQAPGPRVRDPDRARSIEGPS